MATKDVACTPGVALLLSGAGFAVIFIATSCNVSFETLFGLAATIAEDAGKD